MQHPDKGYRRIRDDLEHDFGIQSASGWAKIRAKLINTGIDLVWGVTKKVVTKILEKADANKKAPAQA